MRQLFFYLKVSRPGLWFAMGWLYLLPTSNQPEIFYSLGFWVGFLYVCFPLNFLVYGWNDIVDYETDQLNPRKNSFWFGARGSKEQLSQLWKPLVITQLITIPIVIYFAGIETWWIFVLFFLINAMYNKPVEGWRSKPPLDVISQVGYLLIVPLSVHINQTASLPWQTYLYLFLFAMQSHLMGEVMDYKPDKLAKRHTLVTSIGIVKSKLFIISIVVAEIFSLLYSFKEIVFASTLAIGLFWLLLDVLLIYRNKTYTLFQMKLFAILSNVIAVVTIVYVRLPGCLLHLANYN